MYEHLRPGRNRATTQAAEGLPRWRWTTAELVRLAEMGAFTPEDRFELIGGEIVPMSPAGRRHEVLREELERAWRKRETIDFVVVAEPQFNLTEEAYTKPDVLVRPVAIRSPDVRGDTVLLVVEVADSSLAYDQTTKAALYATHGVRDYWVVDARSLETKVHRNPGSDGFAETFVVAGNDELVPLLVPELAVRIADLDLGD